MSTLRSVHKEGGITSTQLLWRSLFLYCCATKFAHRFASRPILLLCPWTSCVWYDMLGLRINNIGLSTIGKWFEDLMLSSGLMRKEKEGVLMKVAFSLWYIWKERCSSVFQENVPNPLAVVSKIRRAVEEFKLSWEFDDNSHEDVRKNNAQLEKWLLLGRGLIKINCDGAYDSDTRSAGIGIVARDDMGLLVAGAGHYFAGLNVESVEALVVYESLRLAERKGWQQILVETDSEVVVTEIMKTGAKLCWTMAPIIYNIHN